MKRANRTQTPMDGEEKREARRREMPSAAVVFEAIRNTAEAELQRPLLGLAWSAVQTPGGRLLRRSAHAPDRPALFAAQFALSHACWLATYPLAGWLGGASSQRAGGIE